MIQNLKLILEGIIDEIDICTINNKPFVYVGGFGKFMNVPYETARSEKKKFGYIAYIFNGIKDFFSGKTYLYDLTYEIDGKKYNEKCSFLLVSNANQIAGIKNFHKDFKLNDRKFELLFCNLQKKNDILGGLITLASLDATKARGFEFYKTDNLKIHFNTPLKKPWCLDGEMYESNVLDYEIKTDTRIKMLLPKKAIETNFIK